MYSSELNRVGVLVCCMRNYVHKLVLAFHSYTPVLSQKGQHCRACRYDNWVHCILIVRAVLPKA